MRCIPTYSLWMLIQENGALISKIVGNKNPALYQSGISFFKLVAILLKFLIQKPDGVQDAEDGDAYICKDGDPHVGEAYEAEDHDGDLDG